MLSEAVELAHQLSSLRICSYMVSGVSELGTPPTRSAVAIVEYDLGKALSKMKENWRSVIFILLLPSVVHTSLSF